MSNPVFSLSRARVLHRAVSHLLEWPVAGLYAGTCQLQQIRSHKKMPKASKERDKWISKTVRETMKKKEKVIPKNWEEKFMTRVPTDDVWIRMHYPAQRHHMTTALEMHRELACPEMLNNMDGFVFFQAVLDMRTAKKTKFTNDFKALAELPHDFDDGTDHKVLVFCKSQEEHDDALACGATFAGGIELIKMMEKGDIKPYMFDYAVCTFEYLDEVTKARKYIRDKFPNRKQGSIGVDVQQLVRKFRFGKSFETEKTTQAESLIHVNIGKLSFPSEHLVANLNAYLAEMFKYRTKTKVEGPFIKKGFLMCPPNTEKMHIVAEELVPPSMRIQQQPAGPSIMEDEDHDDEETEAAENVAATGH